MTDKGNKKQPSAWFALFTLSLFASALLGTAGLAENEAPGIQVQFKSGETDTEDENVPDTARLSDAGAPRSSSTMGLSGIREAENPHIISDACLPDTLHGPPGSRITTV